MYLKAPYWVVLPAGIACLAFSCSSPVVREVIPGLDEGRYDSEFPNRSCSKELGEICESVKMVSCIAYYRNYRFEMRDRMTAGQLDARVLAAKESSAVYTNSTSSGTATVMFYGDRRVVLLTCAHVVAFPDTILTPFIGPDHRPTPYLKNVAVKEKQVNYVAVFPEGGTLDILAMDRTLDVALLGKRFETDPVPKIRAFGYPIGKARELEWGTFVDLFGYPAGNLVVTKAIVSSPNKDKSGSFLTDAVFTGGFSGGIALAIRNGVPHFELVGIVKLLFGHSYYILSPQREDESRAYDVSEPYTGGMYVERKVDINFGVTQAISMEAVGDFVRSHEAELHDRGYSLPVFENP